MILAYKIFITALAYRYNKKTTRTDGWNKADSWRLSANKIKAPDIGELKIDWIGWKITRSNELSIIELFINMQAHRMLQRRSHRKAACSNKHHTDNTSKLLFWMPIKYNRNTGALTNEIWILFSSMPKTFYRISKAATKWFFFCWFLKSSSL